MHPQNSGWGKRCDATSIFPQFRSHLATGCPFLDGNLTSLAQWIIVTIALMKYKVKYLNIKRYLPKTGNLPTNVEPLSCPLMVKFPITPLWKRFAVLARHVRVKM